MERRDFLRGVGLGVGLLVTGVAAAQKLPPGVAPPPPPVPNRTARTRVLFKTPPGFPNAVSVAPEGLWIAEQKMSGSLAERYGLTAARRSARGGLAGRLERQGSEDHLHPVAQHIGHGRRRRLSVDGLGICPAARRHLAI